MGAVNVHFRRAITSPRARRWRRIRRRRALAYSSLATPKPRRRGDGPAGRDFRPPLLSIRPRTTAKHESGGAELWPPVLLRLPVHAPDVRRSGSPNQEANRGSRSQRPQLASQIRQPETPAAGPPWPHRARARRPPQRLVEPHGSESGEPSPTPPIRLANQAARNSGRLSFLASPRSAPNTGYVEVCTVNRSGGLLPP